MRKKSVLIMGFGAALAAAILVAASILAWDLHAPYKGYTDKVILDVPRGHHAGEILDELCDRGVVRSRVSLKLAYAVTGRLSTLKAGKYLFDKPLTPLEVLGKLRRGDVLYAKLTLPEGLKLDEAARLFEEEGLGKSALFIRAMDDPAPIRDIDPKAQNLEGYLFPESYYVDPGTPEQAIVRMLARAFKEWWSRRENEAAMGFTARGVVTLASIVEKETAVPAERPLIAGLFMNRLRIGMPLQSDPTVAYALSLGGLYTGRLTRDDWGYQSPYNTYQHNGLPPGPICSPGKASLEAVLHPHVSPYLYFVAKNDGTHAFSATLDEHNRAVARYRNGHSNGKTN